MGKSWAEVEPILEIVQGLTEAERETVLDRECAADTELRQEVEAYLAVDTDQVDFLENPVLSLSGEEKPEDRIGPYRVVRELGRGAMGAVYLATRDDGDFEHEVAIKVLKRGLDTDEILWRFRNERQILARLRHPLIATLLDGGSTEDGRPYFVMEHVDGVPIDRYCEQHQLSVTERLRLFKKVCVAVHVAHQHQLVHRDLKPGNILVRSDGEPRLLDFGVAKILDPEKSAATPPTQYTAPLTPQYASPEQFSGEVITTASDVYSLGVLLYQLLTRLLPFSSESLSELRTLTCEVEPERPSITVSRDRRQGSQQLKKRLEGDLDAVVLMALRKDPRRRYQSAVAFSEDTDRYLQNKPIRAQRATVLYRGRRFVRRNRLGVAVAALVLLLSLGFGISTFFQQQAIIQERDQAREISEFMIDVFSVADPNESPGEQITARELLDRGVERVAEEFGDNPSLRADLLETMARSSQGLGLFERARPLLEEVLVLHRERFGDKHPRVAGTLNRLGYLLFNQAEYDSARLVLEEELSIWKELKGSHDLEIAESLNHLGLVLRAQGDYEGAERVHREALRIRRLLLEATDPRVSESILNLSHALKFQQKYEEVLPLTREALEIDKKSSGMIHPNTFASMNGLAVILRKLGRFPEAEETFQETIELGKRLYPDGHTYLSTALNNYALLKGNQADWVAAERLYREAIEMETRFRGRDHLYTATTISNLAVALQSQQRYEEAETLYLEAIEIAEKRLGSDNPETLEFQAKYVDFLWNAGKQDRATSLLEEIAAKRRLLFDDDAPVIATDLHNIAFHREMSGSYAEAEKLCRDALVRDRHSFEPGHPNIVRDLHRLASILEKVDQHKECEELIDEALRYLPTLLPKTHWRIADATSILGGCLAGQGRYKKAGPLLKDSYDLLRADRGDTAWQTQGARQRFADFIKLHGGE